jgi:hypothetical protein
MTMNDELQRMWTATAMGCLYGAVSILPHRQQGNYENPS